MTLIDEIEIFQRSSRELRDSLRTDTGAIIDDEPVDDLLERALAELKAREWVSVFGQLYENEMNIEISTFWDSGYRARLGDSMNGFLADEGGFTSMKDAAQFLLDENRKIEPPEGDK